MTIPEFENILRKPESEILDFKKEQYDIIKDSGNIKTSEFVKDIICFANTIRTETAYIVLGIDVKTDGTKSFLGLDKHIDDATFQEKIKDKVNPKPYFSYYTFDYQNKKFGIIEIPIKKYSEPIAPSKKMKGLQVGKIYFRRGSSNSEAIGKEIILIYLWLKNLPDKNQEITLNDLISNILTKVTSKNCPISECISVALGIANKYRLNKLKNFCNGELTGWSNKIPEEKVPTYLSYRMNKVIISPHEIELNPFNPYNSSQLIKEMKKMDEFDEMQLLFPEPITQLEDTIKRIKEKLDTTLVTFTLTKIFDKKDLGKIQVNVYANRDNYENIYNGIRQKFINELINME